MDSDPWGWGVAEVQHFFRADAVHLLNDRPAAQLPEANSFLQTLKDNDVNGASLLTEIDTSVLRDDFGVSSFRARGAVLHCIRKLRSLSQGYRFQTHLPPPRSPPPINVAPAAPATLKRGRDHDQPLADVGTNIRPGEIEIRDAHGRKHRKLDLSSTQPAIVRQTQPPIKVDVSGYLPSFALHVDEVFYGKTALGGEVGNLQPDGDLDVDLRNPERADQNFSFFAQRKSPGEIEFVHSRMMFFLHKTEPVALTRRGQNAAGLLPYRDGLHMKARSSTVIQANKCGKYVAVREPAALFDSELLESAEKPEELDLGQQSTGEWDFLVTAHPPQEKDEGLPVYGESQSIDAESTVRTIEDDSDSHGVSEESAENLEESRAIQIIDECMEKYLQQWRETKLPHLEAKRAWSVWKKTKKSQSIRDQLIQSAHARIDHLTLRLKKYKERILESKDLDEETVRQGCEVLEVTLQDREEERWKINVWQRRKEPAHVVQTKTSHTQTAAHHTATGHAAPGFVVHPDDQLSVSPTPAQHAQLPAAPEEDGDEIHTPPASPVLPPVESDGVDASDEMSMDRDMSDPEQHATAVDPVETLTASPGAERSASDSPSADISRPVRSPGKDPLSDFKSGQLHATDGSDAELPSPSAFIPSQVKRVAQETPSKNTEPNQSSTTIDLTMSSDSPVPSPSPSPAPRKRGRPRKITSNGQQFSGTGEDATSAEVAAWDVAQLCRERKFSHLLIKLLHNADSRFRDDLHRLIRNLGVNQFVVSLQRSVRALRTGDEQTESVLSVCARLSVAWVALNTEIMQTTEKAPWGASLGDEPWNALLSDETQVKLFSEMLQRFLQRKTSKLFVPPQKTSPRRKLSQINSSSALVEISSSGDERGDSDTAPHKKRKREVQLSQTAMVSRQHAHARQDRYQKRLVESQSTDAAQLEAMLASNPSSSDVAVNPTKEDHQDFIYVRAAVARKMKAHQIEGVRFLWREVANNGEDGGQGCILAHTMGLGKTMQTIALLMAITEAAHSRNPRVYEQLPPHMRTKAVRNQRHLHMLILCPPALLQNWRREIGQWAQDALGKVFLLEYKNHPNHMQLLSDWHHLGGVLLIGYQLFRSKVTPKERVGHEASPEVLRLMLESPEIVIADEVHHLKNDRSGTSLAVARIKTHSRIGLTGTPMSNNVEEIYALVSFVAPGYLGELAEFRDQYTRPIADGTYSESTRSEVRKSIKRLAVLRHEIEPKVHRADINALKGSLKPKTEFVLFVPLTEAQDLVYRRFLIALKGGNDVDKVSQVALFGWLAMLMLLTNHPVPFKQKLLTPRPAAPKQPKPVAREVSPDSGTTTPLQPDDATEMQVSHLTERAYDADVYSLGFTEHMVRTVLEGLTNDLDPARSAKTAIFMDILRYAEECGDKVLVFSTSIPTLNYLNALLESREIRFGRIDGQVEIGKRTKILEDFHNDNFDVLLISTRAGGVGFNIQGANRVIIFDFGFNPTWEEQAIGRAYRLGQEKPVYVYRFVAGGTFETNIYNKQLFKSSLAQRVIDKKNPRRNAERNASEYLYEPKNVKQEDLSQWRGKDKRVLDRILDEYDANGETGRVDTEIRKILTMETLQEEAPDEPLDEEEKREVDEEIKLSRTKGKGRSAAFAGPSPTAPAGYMVPPQSTAPASYRPLRPHLAANDTHSMHHPPPPTQPAGGFRQSLTPTANMLGGLPMFRPPSGSSTGHGHPR